MEMSLDETPPPTRTDHPPIGYVGMHRRRRQSRRSAFRAVRQSTGGSGENPETKWEERSARFLVKTPWIPLSERMSL